MLFRSNQKACSVFVYNLVGEEVISVPAQAEGGLFTLDVSGLPSGVYFLKINNDKITAVEKFLKQ